MEGSIHNLTEYKNFHYTFTFSTILASLPSIYMPPTIVIMWKIVSTYLKSKTPPMDRHIFICICLNFFCSLSFFTSDYFRISLPATGIFTSWCATVQPNHYFKIIFFLTFFFNYCVLMIPFFLSFIRVIILLRPIDYPYICPKIMCVFLPLLFIIPFGCTAFMIPAMGYCRTMGHPLKFGAIYIYYSGGWKGIESNKKGSTRAERSLTITIIAAMIPFINNTILTVVYLTLPDYVFFFIIIRPFGNDIETCMMPWILFITHPMFKNQARRASVASTVSVVPRHSTL